MELTQKQFTTLRKKMIKIHFRKEEYFKEETRRYEIWNGFGQDRTTIFDDLNEHGYTSACINNIQYRWRAEIDQIKTSIGSIKFNGFSFVFDDVDCIDDLCLDFGSVDLSNIHGFEISDYLYLSKDFVIKHLKKTSMDYLMEGAWKSLVHISAIYPIFDIAGEISDWDVHFDDWCEPVRCSDINPEDFENMKNNSFSQQFRLSDAFSDISLTQFDKSQLDDAIAYFIE